MSGLVTAEDFGESKLDRSRECGLEQGACHGREGIPVRGGR